MLEQLAFFITPYIINSHTVYVIFRTALEEISIMSDQSFCKLIYTDGMNNRNLFSVDSNVMRFQLKLIKQ